MDNELRNTSGCIDKTAYKEIKNIRREERKCLINLLKLTAEKHGYRITGRIYLSEIEAIN